MPKIHRNYGICCHLMHGSEILFFNVPSMRNDMLHIDLKEVDDGSQVLATCKDP